MTQAKDVIGTVDKLTSQPDVLVIPKDSEKVASTASTEGASEKKTKGRTSRRRVQAKKKHYTEDSIRSVPPGNWAYSSIESR